MTHDLAAIFARPIAHRGLHDRLTRVIENTRDAFAAALAKGFGMECDIQASADGEAMVFHDFTLDRLTTGTGRVDSLPERELRTLHFRETGARMESLSDLLTHVAGKMPLIVEIKSRHDGSTALASRVAAIVAEYPGPLVLKSFDPKMIIALREAGIRQPVGIVAMSMYDFPDYAALSRVEKHALANLLHFDATRPDFLSWNHRDLPSAAPYFCRAKLGLPVLGWTIRSTADAATARPHVDQIVFEGFTPD